MSHRITLQEAEVKYQHELECRELTKQGKTPKPSRRQKKYLIQVKKQKGFFKYLAARNKLHGNLKAAEHFTEEAEA